MEIDWSAPWLAPYRVIGQHVAADAAAQPQPVGAVASALNMALQMRLPGDVAWHWPQGPVRFVPAHEQPPGEAYEAFIARTGCVPTRDNLHDFFNGLMWLHHPALKRQLNQLQAAEIDRLGSVTRRGPARDALTVFDENAALFCAPQPLLDALAARDWQALFIGLRPLWREARLQLFGHALMEKLTAPRKAITAHVWCVPHWQGDAAPLMPSLPCKAFAPLPVLGVPGWWAANETPAFYADALVFRPARSPR